MSEYVQVMTTVNDSDEGIRLARSIGRARLAACVQVSSPIHSVYWWHGELQEAQEYHLFIKTTEEQVPALQEHIKANHSYEVPEIIITSIVGGSTEYLDWISTETRSDQPRDDEK